MFSFFRKLKILSWNKSKAEIMFFPWKTHTEVCNAVSTTKWVYRISVYLWTNLISIWICFPGHPVKICWVTYFANELEVSRCWVDYIQIWQRLYSTYGWCSSIGQPENSSVSPNWFSPWLSGTRNSGWEISNPWWKEKDNYYEILRNRRGVSRKWHQALKRSSP